MISELILLFFGIYMLLNEIDNFMVNKTIEELEKRLNVLVDNLQTKGDKE